MWIQEIVQKLLPEIWLLLTASTGTSIVVDSYHSMVFYEHINTPYRSTIYRLAKLAFRRAPLFANLAGIINTADRNKKIMMNEVYAFLTLV